MSHAEEYAEAVAYVHELGYNNISAYVQGMAEDYGVPIESARWLYTCLGPSEIADGFLTALEDYCESRGGKNE